MNDNNIDKDEIFKNSEINFSEKDEKYVEKQDDKSYHNNFFDPPAPPAAGGCSSYGEKYDEED